MDERTNKTKERLLMMADKWIDDQGGKIDDVGDYRRIVQTVIELQEPEIERAAAAVLRIIMEQREEIFRLREDQSA
jgi:hypothetical protein